MNITLTSVIVAVLVLGGCREKQAASTAKAPATASMNMRADSLMPAMHAHLDSLALMPGDRLRSVISAHEAMASKMLHAIGGDMTAMGVKADSAWRTLRDSVERDLADLPALRGAPLEQRVKAHIDRLKRLLAMHEIMMREAPKS
jgi:hypothetical protein